MSHLGVLSPSLSIYLTLASSCILRKLNKRKKEKEMAYSLNLEATKILVQALLLITRQT